LSTWFKDYLYIPLGGNRVKEWRKQFNLFFVFLVSGLWHGADWKFIIWGSLHGVFLVFGNITEKVRLKIRQVIGLTRVKWLDDTIQRAVTFVLVTIAWVFFRADTTKDAVYMISRIPGVFGEVAQMLKTRVLAHGLPGEAYKLAMCWAVILVMESIHYIQRKRSIGVLLDRQPVYVRWFVYYVFLFSVMYLGVFENRQFIYFQF
jgi:hypothetical protein